MQGRLSSALALRTAGIGPPRRKQAVRESKADLAWEPDPLVDASPAWPFVNAPYEGYLRDGASFGSSAYNRKVTPLQIFISWSGKQSQHVAVALRTWLPTVLDNKVKPFVSSEDIDKGDRGLNKIAAQLEESAYGIVVVTPSNQDSPWINFEAGALGKSVSDGRVAPLLVGLTDPDVKGPIKQFQNSEASDEKAVLSLIRSLNSALSEPLSLGTLDVLFEKHWPELKAAIAKAPTDGAVVPKENRSEADLLNEVLTSVRALQRNVDRMQAEMAKSKPTGSGKLEREVVDLLMDALDISSIGITSVNDELLVRLPEEAGSLDGQLLRRLQNLAKKNTAAIEVRRPNGASVAYAPDGTETRTPAHDPEPLED
jgi:hypothetical protein